MATLALLDFPKLNTVAVGSDGLVRGVGDPVALPSFDKGLTFTGIAVYEPGFLRFLPEGVSSVVDAWIAAISAGHRIGAFDVSG